MNRSEQSVEDLRREITSMVKSKFTPPFMKEEVRRSVDSIIFEIWQELNSRKESDGDSK